MGTTADETEQRRLKRQHHFAPKLRMIANGDAEVNAYRAAMSGSVQSTSSQSNRAPDALRKASYETETPAGLEAPPSRTKLTPTASVSCFVHTAPGANTSNLHRAVAPSAIRGGLALADLSPATIDALATGRYDLDQLGISYVETGSALTPPAPLSSVSTTAAPQPPAWLTELPTAEHRVIVGVIDVGGFDFAHPDFLRPDGSTRFLSIWDQGDPQSTRTPASAPTPEVEFGRVYSASDMNAAIADAHAAGVAPSDFLIQSVQVVGSHATHVASIAAGNSGVCPEADIIGVSIALGDDDLDRRTTFYDSTRLAHAVDFLTAFADSLGVPIAINISLGTNGHAHDGTSPIARWIDTAVAQPGRCVCAAAGNAGQEAAQFEGDIGYLSGRIHSSGTIAAGGLIADIEWKVVGNGRLDVSENEMEIWYHPGDEFLVQVRSPDGAFTSDWVKPGEFYENKQLPGTGTFFSVYNERFHPANGANRISVFLSPRLKPPIVGVQAGTWTIRLKGEEVRDGRFNAWIERDDARPVGRIGDGEAWRFPSYFSQRSNVDSHSVSSLACGRDVIGVGNVDHARERVHVTSSQGPTWDGRPKPDIAAPGTRVVAANGFAGRAPAHLWVAKTGTSMASPYVCGVAANMLARQPKLTATQILGIVRRTARPLPGADYAWQNDAGYGVIDPVECLNRRDQPFRAVDKDPS